jgi:hypothetical protein
LLARYRAGVGEHVPFVSIVALRCAVMTPEVIDGAFGLYGSTQLL